MSAHERTSWRDLRLSLRHREWGLDLGMTDIDFFVIEYRNPDGTPKALVDYKHESCDRNRWGENTVGAQAILGTKAGLPFFIVLYSHDLTRYEVYPRNGHARKFVPQDMLLMDEDTYVRFLFQVRDLPIPPRGAWRNPEEAA